MSVSRGGWCLLAVILLWAAGPGKNVARGDEPSLSGSNPLGETPAQIEQRYGPARRHNARVRHHQVLEGGSAMDGDLYEKNGIVIRVVFQHGVAVLLEFNRVAGPLLATDVHILLAETSGGFVWQPGAASTEASKFYNRSDNHAVAHWTTDADGSLLIATEDANQFNDKLLP